MESCGGCCAGDPSAAATVFSLFSSNTSSTPPPLPCSAHVPLTWPHRWCVQAIAGEANKVIHAAQLRLSGADNEPGVITRAIRGQLAQLADTAVRLGSGLTTTEAQLADAQDALRRLGFWDARPDTTSHGVTSPLSTTTTSRWRYSDYDASMLSSATRGRAGDVSGVSTARVHRVALTELFPKQRSDEVCRLAAAVPAASKVQVPQRVAEPRTSAPAPVAAAPAAAPAPSAVARTAALAPTVGQPAAAPAVSQRAPAAASLQPFPGTQCGCHTCCYVDVVATPSSPRLSPGIRGYELGHETWSPLLCTLHRWASTNIIAESSRWRWCGVQSPPFLHGPRLLTRLSAR